MGSRRRQVLGNDRIWWSGIPAYTTTKGRVCGRTIDNIETLYEGNKVFLNGYDGIKHEISYDAILRHNLVAANGKSKDDWLWGAQILIQNSSNVQVYRNLVEVAADFGNGIGIVYQDRGEGAHGPWYAIRNAVYDNTIIHLGSLRPERDRDGYG